MIRFTPPPAAPPLRRGGKTPTMYNIFNHSKMLERRKILRNALTPEEYKLWFHLKGKNLRVKYRRQQGIGPYIADFYCKEKNLVIELDGSRHLDAKQYDEERDLYLQTLGIKVIRFWNNDINKNMEGVLLKIKSELE